MLAHCREGDFAIHECGNLRPIRRMNRIARSAVNDGVLHIGDILHTEQRQLARRHLPNLFDFVHLILPAELGTAESPRRAQIAWPAIGAHPDLYSPNPALHLGTEQLNMEKPII